MEYNAETNEATPQHQDSKTVKKKKKKRKKEPVSTQSFQIIEPVFSDPVSESPHSDLSTSQNLNSISELDGDVTDVISDDDYDYQCSDGSEW